MHTCCLIVRTREFQLNAFNNDCWNNGFEDDARRCFTTRTREFENCSSNHAPICQTLRTRGYGDEQDGFGAFPSSNRTEKVPPGGLWCSPMQAIPRIMIYYAPIATANRQARQARRAFPCRRSAMRCPLCCFWLPALTEHGAKTIAYNQSAKESNENKPTRQKAKEKGKPIILYNTHIQKQEKRKASNNRQARQREKQKRSPKSI